MELVQGFVGRHQVPQVDGVERPPHHPEAKGET